MRQTKWTSYLILALALPLSGLAALAAARSEEAVAATITVVLLGGLTFAAVAFSPSSKGVRAPLAIFGAGLGLRVLAAALLYHWDPSFFSSDQGVYFLRGAELAARWHADGLWPSTAWLVGGPGNCFVDFWAAWSYFVGPSELALRMLMSVVGAYGAVRGYVLAKEFLGPREARVVGWLMACWPSLIGWSAQGLRDSLIIWFWCEVGLGLIRLSRKKTAMGLGGLALSLYGLTLFRPYAAVLAAAGACLALVAGRPAAGRLRGTSLLGLVAVGGATLAGGLGFLGAGMLPMANLETVDTIRVGFQEGNTSFGEGLSVGTWSLALLYLPLGLAYFMLAPFPWHMHSAPQMAAILEQPGWYAVVALAGYGLLRLVRSKQPGSLALAALALPGIIFYALAMSNVGTALRDRAQFSCFVFVYAAHGYVSWQTRRTDARRGSGRRPLARPGRRT